MLWKGGNKKDREEKGGVWGGKKGEKKRKETAWENDAGNFENIG